ncbi:hypothetical protein [Crassaminicella profunda]|nr:hypothetical protein [Crassaminicella profunda]QZY55237.1 hypothetical protein K7H06_19905 [Crassaminicella profunda]
MMTQIENLFSKLELEIHEINDMIERTEKEIYCVILEMQEEDKSHNN